MAGSPTPRQQGAEPGPGHHPANLRGALPAPIAAALDAFRPDLPFGVAFSGGADSTALLLACVRRWPGQVHAVHIHHGLQPAADLFVSHCQSLCSAMSVPLVVRHVDATARNGVSPEDAARRARYAAFDQIASAEWSHLAIKTIALGQHLDDQAETVLLALLRGSGLPGLAAMPAVWTRGHMTFHRPFLQVTGAQLRQWLAQEGIAWVDDPSNDDHRFTRNRLRQLLVPGIDASFPHFRQTVARGARHAAQAVRLLDELAGQDLAVVGDPPSIHALQCYSADRQANVLRFWLKRSHNQMPAEAQLAQLQKQIAACTTRGHRLNLKVGGGRILRDGERLRWVPDPVGA